MRTPPVLGCAIEPLVFVCDLGDCELWRDQSRVIPWVLYDRASEASVWFNNAGRVHCEVVPEVFLPLVDAVYAATLLI